MAEGTTSRKPLSRPHEILVALSHLDQIRAVFTQANRDPNGAPVEHPVEFEVVEENEALGLAQLRLPDIATAAARLAEFVTPYLVGRDVAGIPAEGEADHLDRVLIGLRSYFASECGGWVPTLGKNRLVGLVTGADAGTDDGGIISHGGGGMPRRVSVELPPRGDGPGRGVRIGLLDTRIAPAWWLAGGWTAPYNEVLRPAFEFRQPSGHAAFVAGLILGQAPMATVQVRGVLDENGRADAWTVAKQIVAFGESGIDILNLSLVCYTADHRPPLALSTAIDRLDPRIVIVAAAGNHGDVDVRVPGLTPDDAREPAWPAALDDVVAVGASTADDGVAPFTPRNAKWIDLFAPGVNVVSTYLTGRVLLDDGLPRVFNGFAGWSGTSFSAGLVSGAVAARTIPGRVSAREALREVRALAEAASHTTPPIVKLDVPTTDGEA